MRDICASTGCLSALKQPWYVATRIIQYVNETVKSDCISTQWLKAQKNHGNLALVFTFGFIKTNPNSLFVKLLSVTVWTFLKLYPPNEV